MGRDASRTAFIGEQPNPWELLHPQDAMSRHRGAKPPRRCERSGEILGVLLRQENLAGTRSFPPGSACRHAARTVSSPSSIEDRVPLVQSLRLLTAHANRAPRCLLIVRTHGIVTGFWAGSLGCTEFPAYRGVITDVPLPTRGP